MISLAAVKLARLMAYVLAFQKSIKPTTKSLVLVTMASLLVVVGVIRFIQRLNRSFAITKLRTMKLKQGLLN